MPARHLGLVRRFELERRRAVFDRVGIDAVMAGMSAGVAGRIDGVRGMRAAS